MQEITQWPIPAEFPLYMPIIQAAKIVGISEDTMRSWVNDPINPIPTIRVGKKSLVRTAALPGYAMTKESR